MKNPPNGVFTPDELLMADLVKDPEMGIDPKKEPAKLDTPRATISCVASMLFPFSEISVSDETRFTTNNVTQYAKSQLVYVPKAFPIAIVSIIDIRGAAMTVEPIFEIISPNVWF